MITTTFEQRELVKDLFARGITDERVLKAIYEVPRPLFVEEVFAHRCYQNVALPIGEGQTISQPYIVAKMTALLQLRKRDKVLEIGTGCGYQTAILAKLAEQVVSIERIKKLQWDAMFRLKKLHLHNVLLKHGDGWQGLAAKAPFNAILVTAAAPVVPAALFDQLADGGRLVIPIGNEHQQVLQRITKINQRAHIEHIEPVKFVPLIEGDII